MLQQERRITFAGRFIDCFIRKNTPELRSALHELGLDMCPCATNWGDGGWLTVSKGRVHVVPESEQGLFLHENKTLTDCGENEPLFIILAANAVDRCPDLEVAMGVVERVIKNYLKDNGNE